MDCAYHRGHVHAAGILVRIRREVRRGDVSGAASVPDGLVRRPRAESVRVPLALRPQGPGRKNGVRFSGNRGDVSRGGAFTNVRKRAFNVRKASVRSATDGRRTHLVVLLREHVEPPFTPGVAPDVLAGAQAGRGAPAELQGDALVDPEPVRSCVGQMDESARKIG